MQKVNNSKTKGFTLIEVVLVLAIAGLIFLIVFLALPALQRSQRDTQRKNDVSRLMSQISNYQSNNQGNIPGTGDWGGFITNYMTAGGQQFSDPEGAAYSITALTSAATAPSATKGTITVYQPSTGARCDTDPSNGVAASTGGNSRQIAVVIPVEQGGFYCQQN